MGGRARPRSRLAPPTTSALGHTGRMAWYTPESPEREVRDVVYRTLAKEGRAPSVRELARITGTSTQAVERRLALLASEHALVLAPEPDAIRMAHPFATAPMAFVVTPLDGLDDRRWWGGCAWDSFGISAALSLDVRIDTSCPSCGAALQYAAGPDTPPPVGLAIRFPRPAAQWWDDVVETCTMIRTFCDHSHAENWASSHAAGTGYVAPATQVWRLAQGWYGDRLAPDFQPHTREHNQALLTACNFTGAFWQLP